MTRSIFTPHQRDILIRRIARAVLWSKSPTYDRDAANHTARTVVEELEVSGFSAAAQRRAIENVVTNLERTA